MARKKKSKMSFEKALLAMSRAKSSGRKSSRRKSSNDPEFESTTGRNVIRTLRKIKDKVAYILKHSKASRDNDVYLYITYLHKFHGLADEIGIDNCKKLFKLMNNSPYSASITRCRRKLQEAGHYVGARRGERTEEERHVRKGIKKL